MVIRSSGMQRHAGGQDRQVIAGARQVSLVSGH